MFSNLYRENMVTVRLMIWLCCEGEDETEHQVYGEAWVTSMVTVRIQVQEPGLGLGFGVWLAVHGG